LLAVLSGEDGEYRLVTVKGDSTGEALKRLVKGGCDFGCWPIEADLYVDLAAFSQLADLFEYASDEAVAAVEP
jgi:hypothetical protein